MYMIEGRRKEAEGSINIGKCQDSRRRPIYTTTLVFLFVTDYRHYVETRDRHPEGSKTASTPPYILLADRYYLQITIPISAIYYPIIPYYPHLLRVYIEPLELYLQSSCLCISTLCKAYSYKPGSHCLLTNYLDYTTCCTINLLPYLRSHHFFYLYKCFKLLPGTAYTRNYLHLPNGRIIEHRLNRTLITSNIAHIEY